MTTLRLVYDQENDGANVIEWAQNGFEFAVNAIRKNDYKVTEGLLVEMQRTFDNVAAIAKAVVA